MISKNRVVAITVSTNYSDILPYTLKQNLPFLDHWYIVTDENDLATYQAIREANSDKITVLNYEFKTEYYDQVAGGIQKRYFDKGGAIATAQSIAYEEWPEHWYLVMDTDIMIRSARDLITDHLCQQRIWGPRSRLDYRSWTDYQESRVQRDYFNNNPKIIGFFQLYRRHYLYQPSVDTNWCDNQFTDLWVPEEQAFLSITVDHLGAWENDLPNTHHGRILGSGFKKA